MTGPSRDLDPRVLVRSLPELIGGANPVSSSVAAREQLSNDLTLRAAVAALAEVAHAAETGDPRRLLRSGAGRSLAETFTRSSGLFARAMGDVFYRAGLAYLQRATEGELHFVRLHRAPLAVRPAHELHRTETALLDVLGARPDGHDLRLVRTALAAAASTNAEDHQQLATLHLDAAARLMPNNADVEYYRIQATLVRNPHNALSMWTRYRERFFGLASVGFGLHESGRTHLDRDEPVAAVELIDRAQRHLPAFAVVRFNGFMAATIAQQADKAHRFLDAFLGMTQLTENVVYCEAIRSQPQLWRTASKRSTVLLEDAMRRMPDSLAATLTEVMS